MQTGKQKKPQIITKLNGTGCKSYMGGFNSTEEYR